MLKVCGELVREGLQACKLAWTHTPRSRRGELWGHWAHQNPSQIELHNYSQMHGQHNAKAAFPCTAISLHRSDFLYGMWVLSGLFFEFSNSYDHMYF